MNGMLSGEISSKSTAMVAPSSWPVSSRVPEEVREELSADIEPFGATSARRPPDEAIAVTCYQVSTVLFIDSPIIRIGA